MQLLTFSVLHSAYREHAISQSLYRDTWFLCDSVIKGIAKLRYAVNTNLNNKNIITNACVSNVTNTIKHKKQKGTDLCFCPLFITDISDGSRCNIIQRIKVAFNQDWD